MDTENMIPEVATHRPTDAFLELMFGPETGRRFPVGDGETMVGRGEEADFVLDDPTVSRRHARITVEDGSYWLHDMDSANGTRVNGEETKKSKLAMGALIEIGASVLVMKRGYAPAEAAPTGPVHSQETVKMPTLASVAKPEETTSADLPVAPPRKWSFKAVMAGRSSRHSPLFAQFVSWLVVLCVAVGGVLLLMNLLDSGVFDGLSDEEGGVAAISSPRHERATPIVAPPKKKKGPGSELGDLPMDDAPDVAQELYDEADRAQREGDLETAVAILKEVKAKYPEFQPIGGRPILEEVAELERAISFSGTVRWGKEALADDAIDALRLQQLLTELASIPANDDRYGEDAMALADQTRERLKNLQAQPEEEPVESDQPVSDVVVQSEDLGDVVATPDGDVVAENAVSLEQVEAANEAVARAEELYGRGAFQSAASRVLEVATTLPDGERSEELKLLAKRMRAFERAYDDAMSIRVTDVGNLLRVEALEDALVADLELPGKYVREIRIALAQELVKLATQSLEQKRYPDARKYLDDARKHDRSAREVSRVANLFAFRAAALLRESLQASDPEVKRRLASSALQLAAENSPLAREAQKALEKGSGEAAP